MAVVQWLRLQYPKVLFTISPGGLLTNARTGSKAKKLGYQKGVPDIIIFESRQWFHGLFIEMKIEGGKTSPEQKEYIAGLIACGYMATVCYGFDEAKKIIDNYFSYAEEK